MKKYKSLKYIAAVWEFSMFRAVNSWSVFQWRFHSVKSNCFVPFSSLTRS